MAQPEMSPIPSGPRPELGARHITGDDIDLPPLPPNPVEARTEPEHRSPDLPAGKRTATQRLSPWLVAAGLAAALAVGSWWWHSSHSAESANPNWSLVAAAKAASADQRTTILTHRDLAGKAHLSPTVDVSLVDSNPALTLAVQAMLGRNDLAAANAALQAATVLPATTLAPKSGHEAKPELRPNTRLITAIRDGSAQFFNMRLFDCCAEDGDVVDLAINGESYARVPLTNAGTVISLPLIPGKTVISIKGVQDGGGGITVSFQSSQGDYFCQPIDEGEEFQVGVVVR